MNGSRKCGIYTIEFYSTRRKNDNNRRSEGKWMQLEVNGSNHAKLLSQAQKDKATYFLLYMEDRSKNKYIHKNKHNDIQTYAQPLQK
jgi:hypothetical protein